MKKFTFVTFVVMFVFVFSACSTNQKDPRGMAVEKYLQAVISTNADEVAPLSCADWESSARDEAAAFVGVKARLDNVSCASSSPDGDSAVVSCTGSIVATYGNEDSTFELAGKQFQVVRQNAEWFVCGYAQ